MTFWIIAAVVVVVAAGLVWWTSGRSKRAAFDPHRAQIRSEAYATSQETQARFDPRGP